MKFNACLLMSFGIMSSPQHLACLIFITQPLSEEPHRFLGAWTLLLLTDLLKILTFLVTGLKSVHSKKIESRARKTTKNQREITSPKLHHQLKTSTVSSATECNSTPENILFQRFNCLLSLMPIRTIIASKVENKFISGML